MNKLIETLATLEHEQWMEWTRTLILNEPTLSSQRIERWNKLFVSYSELTEGYKEQDRKWARKTLFIIYNMIMDFPDVNGLISKEDLCSSLLINNGIKNKRK
jgi:hypothetical protein